MLFSEDENPILPFFPSLKWKAQMDYFDIKEAL